MQKIKEKIIAPLLSVVLPIWFGLISLYTENNFYTGCLITISCELIILVVFLTCLLIYKFLYDK